LAQASSQQIAILFIAISCGAYWASACFGVKIAWHVPKQNGRGVVVSLKKRKKLLRATLKVFTELADNLNNGGLQGVSAGKASVTAS
jgi:hypothetical protein